MVQHSGIDIEDQDFAMIAKAMGIESVTVRKSSELAAAFDQALAVTKAGRPFLIDAKITAKRGLPVEELEMKIEDGKLTESISANYNANHTLPKADSVEEFFAAYNGEELKPLTHFFDKAGVEL